MHKPQRHPQPSKARGTARGFLSHLRKGWGAPLVGIRQGVAAETRWRVGSGAVRTFNVLPSLKLVHLGAITQPYSDCDYSLGWYLLLRRILYEG